MIFTSRPLLFSGKTCLRFALLWAVPYIELVVEVVVGAGEFVENCRLLCADAAEPFSTRLLSIRELVVE
jgi:hypothetical protein